MYRRYYTLVLLMLFLSVYGCSKGNESEPENDINIEVQKANYNVVVEITDKIRVTNEAPRSIHGSHIELFLPNLGSKEQQVIVPDIDNSRQFVDVLGNHSLRITFDEMSAREKKVVEVHYTLMLGLKEGVERGAGSEPVVFQGSNISPWKKVLDSASDEGGASVEGVEGRDIDVVDNKQLWEESKEELISYFLSEEEIDELGEDVQLLENIKTVYTANNKALSGEAISLYFGWVCAQEEIESCMSGPISFWYQGVSEGQGDMSAWEEGRKIVLVAIDSLAKAEELIRLNERIAGVGINAKLVR